MHRKLVHQYYVYIVECSDGTYYTGVTNDVRKRVQEHNEGIKSDGYIAKRKPVVLRYYLTFQYIEDAIAWEKKIKGWSRQKKEALFREDWDEVVRLASVRYGKDKSGRPARK